MRIKTILSLIAFVAAFALSTALAALTTDSSQPKFRVTRLQADSSTSRNITAFLQQDIQNGQQRNRRVYRFEDDASLSSPNIFKRSEAVSDYSEASGSMDSNNLPQDFQLAWLKHMRAWHNYSDFLQKAKTQSMSYREMNQLENQYNREINQTWYDVLRVGNKYGANVIDY